MERSHLEAGSIRCDDGLDSKAVEVQIVTVWYRQVAGLCGEEPHLVLPNAGWSFYATKWRRVGFDVSSLLIFSVYCQGYGLDNAGFDSWQGERLFFFCPERPNRLWGPPSLLLNGCRVSFPVVKWQGP